MNTKDFLRMGIPLGQATRRATDFVAQFILGGGEKSRLREEVAANVANPSAFLDDPLRGEFAKALLSTPQPGLDEDFMAYKVQREKPWICLENIGASEGIRICRRAVCRAATCNRVPLEIRDTVRCKGKCI